MINILTIHDSLFHLISSIISSVDAFIYFFSVADLCERDLYIKSKKRIIVFWSFRVEYSERVFHSHPPVLAHNGDLMIGEIVVIMEPVYLVAQCTGVVF